MESRRLAYLDVLKAIAIIAVVLYHSGLVKYGYLGVDIFLVLSGFLVTKSLDWRILSSDPAGGEKRCSYVTFVISRVLRLLPVLLVAGLVAMAVGWFTMLPDDYENLSESVVATNLFGNNILSAITTGDYWNIANDYKPLMHTWYVGLLLQICLVYPLLFYIARLDKKAPRKTLLIVISSLAVLSLLAYFGCSNDAHRFYYPPSRFYEFALGGIAALVYEPSRDKPFRLAFSYLCYALLLALLFVGYRLLPDSIRLVLVVGLSVVLVMSGGALDNGVTSNKVLAKIGVASYSIFVWHQVLLAFYRYIFGNQFTVWSYLLLLAAVGVVSWGSYRVIEQGVARALQFASGRRGVWIATASLFVLLTGFAGWVYMNAGVVRDVPELGVSVKDRHRRMNAEYCERGYQYDRPFASSDKLHWLVIGNSFGRDFVNVVLESCVAGDVEVSFTDKFDADGMDERLAAADLVFVAWRGFSRRLVTEVEVRCWACGIPPERVVVVGDKSFGENNGHVYALRGRPDYFEQRAEPVGGERFLARNRRFGEFFGSRFLDMMDFVLAEDGRVRVFTPGHCFISADCKHLTAYGARFYAEMIDWDKYLGYGNRQ